MDLHTTCVLPLLLSVPLPRPGESECRPLGDKASRTGRVLAEDGLQSRAGKVLANIIPTGRVELKRE